MEINDLRIGNFTTNGTVVNIFEDHFYTKVGSIVFNSKYHDANSIPLTEEWLLKLGFTDNEYSFYLKVGRKTITFNWYSRVVSTGVRGGFYCKKYKHIKNVHQLQNLYYALTGKELTTI